MHIIKGYKDEWRIQEYLLITFFISWLSWGILILLTTLNIIKFTDVLGMIFFIIGGFGPTISALMCIDGKLTWKKIANFIFGRKPGTFWFLLLILVLEIVLAIAASSGTNPEVPLYALPIIFIVCTLFGGGNEELGWRGTMQPLLEKVLISKIKKPFWNFIISTLIVGTVWLIWHVPLWFVNGSLQQSISFLWFAADIFVQAFILVCVYRRTGSVFNCMLLHGLLNTLTTFFIMETSWILICGNIILVILAVLFACWPRNNAGVKGRS